MEWGANLLPSTVSWLEVAWTAPAIIGALRYAWRWRITWLTRARVYRDGINGAYRIVGTMRCYRFALTTIAFELFSNAGIKSMLEPQGPMSDITSWDAWVITASLMGGQILFVITGEIMDMFERGLERLYAMQQEDIKSTRDDDR